ncbi:MAG: chromosomal replication initiator protein DnaA [Gemmatimonadetes bacterium]|nr:MAG: chromosomal replication initiator protein DnaA [Gemmatimonadota bacterium]TLY53893.1 MAG: chromosomal replication initiator protein DnaA [Gemmatimonadota bacterium]
MRRRLRGRYVGPIHSSRKAGKRTPLSPHGSRLTFPHARRSFGPPLLDVPPFRQSRMEQSTKEAWKRLLDEARRELPDATVRTWLEPAVPIALDDGRLIVGAPDQFAVEWNESKHATVLARAAERVFGRPTSVVFRVQEDRQQRPQMDFFVAPREPVVVDKAGVPTTPLNERYTFQTFVIGKSNELAAAAAHAVAEAPGKTYNPLFIYGATGLGKTHLMQAVAHAVLGKYPGTRVHYFGAEQFINEVIESIHARTMSEFRRRYRNDLDLFLVDDVHFLEGKEMTQEEFFHTFNALFEAHKQIVLTSDRPPKEIPGLEDRLISRFEWGLVADIGHPDLEHRIAILRKKAEQDHLELTIPDDVLRFIAEHIRSSVRELEGCIIKLLLFASLKNREVTIELAREALSDKIRQGEEGTSYGQPTPSIDRVQEVVARRWGVTPEGLRSKARTKTLTIPRQVAMYLARNMLSMQLVEIGQAFGGRDHSTVIHSVDKVERQMMRDRTFKERVEMARQELSAL